MVKSTSDRSYSSSWSGSRKRGSRAESSNSHDRQNDYQSYNDSRKSQAETPRGRTVYIKMRPAFGLDMDFSELLDAFQNRYDPNKESGKERFRPLHWAVEIGPWTIELAKDPSKPREVCMTSTHVREWDPSWEKELSRMKVGTTFLSDKRLCRPREILKDKMQPYHLFSSNCQNAAAKFSIAVCEDRPGAYDEIFLSPYRRTAFLTMKEPLEFLKELEGWESSSPDYILRVVPVQLRISGFEMVRDNQQSFSGSETNKNDYLRRIARKYLDLERQFYPSLTGKQVGDLQYDDDREQDNMLFAQFASWYKIFDDAKGDSKEE